MPQAHSARTPSMRTFLTVAAVLVLPVFLALKLAGAVGWSWWWVMSPLWLTATAAVIVAALVALAYTLFRWLLLAAAWMRFRHQPEFTLSDPAVLSRIQAERESHDADA